MDTGLPFWRGISLRLEAPNRYRRRRNRNFTSPAYVKMPRVRRALPDLTQVSGAAAAPRSLAERPLPAPMEGVGLDDMALEAALDGFLPPGGSSTRVRDDHCVYGGLNFVSFVTSIDQQVRR